MRGFLPAHFGALVVVAFHETGKQQRDVALAAGISASYMNDVYHGRRIPPIETALKIGAALGIREEVTYWSIGVLPPRFRQMDVTEDGIIQGFRAMEDALQRSGMRSL